MAARSPIFFTLVLLPTIGALRNHPYNSFYPTNYANLDLNLTDALATICLPEATAYHQDANDYSCRPLVSCLLGAMSELEKADIGGAAVLLGLTPTILSALGPASSEMVLLLTHRPFLASLIAIGAPSIFPARPGEYADPAESLHMREGARTGSVASRAHGPRLSSTISLLQYILVGGAVANVLQTVLELGTHGVITFRCNSILLPLVWTLWPILIHYAAWFSYLFSNTYALSRASNQAIREGQGLGGTSRSWLRNEVTPCANHIKSKFKQTDEPVPVLFLNYLASFVGLIHVVFGTLVFSSVLFVGIERAIYIVLRLILSALICRSVMSFEIAGLRGPQSGSKREEEMPSEPVELQSLSKGR